MEPILFAFIVAFLAEWGDKTQLLILALATRGGRTLPILAGVAIGGGANYAAAGWGGAQLHALLEPRAISLLLAVALFYAGITALIQGGPSQTFPGARRSAFLGATIGVFLLEFGDKTQFATLALAARSDAPALAAAGAVTGLLAAALPAALLGETMMPAPVLGRLRRIIGGLFLIAAAATALMA